MPLIPPPPGDPRETRLFKALIDKTTPSDGLVDRAETLIRIATPLLDLIVAGPFQHYTLHNRDHSKKVLHLAGELMLLGTLSELTGADCFAMICLSYLHDIGMAISSVERDRIINSPDFHDAIQSWPDLVTEIESTEKYIRSNNELEQGQLALRLFQLQEAALAFYLRPRHAEPKRYRAIFTLLKQDAGRSDLFSPWGISIEEMLIEMSVSHNMDAAVLVETADAHEDRFPRSLPVGRQTLNCQFCAALLRLADVLDFDRERTPKILFDSLGIAFRNQPGADVSLREWSRHMAIYSVSLDPDEMVVAADCHHPVIEAAIRDYCRIVERELRDTSAVLKRNRPEILAKYSLDLPISVRWKIRSIGYVFKDMSLRLNQKAIMSLLMGDRLYSRSVVAVRELLQNAIDACQARSSLTSPSMYLPIIDVASERDVSGNFWLIVTDNGIGMDAHVLNDYFLEVGSSYYSSPEFDRALRSSATKPFVPISRFGIGIVSAFMLADSIVVLTRAAASPRGDSQARQIVIHQVGSLAFVTEEVEREPGTTVRLKLKVKDWIGFMNLVNEIIGYLNESVLRPVIPIRVRLGTATRQLRPERFFEVHSEGRVYMQGLGIEPIAIRLSRWSNSLNGQIVLLFWRGEDGKLSHYKDNAWPVIGQEGLLPQRAFKGFEGNRITVNGFRMMLKKINRIFSYGRQRITAAIDCDVIGDDEIVYDVSRERVIGAGAMEIRNRIRAAVQRSIHEMNLASVLLPATKDLLTMALRAEVPYDVVVQGAEVHYVEDLLLLQAVFRSVPEGQWPKYIHKTIAADLGISHNLAARAISTLLARNAIIRTENEAEGALYHKTEASGLWDEVV